MVFGRSFNFPYEMVDFRVLFSILGVSEVFPREGAIPIVEVLCASSSALILRGIIAGKHPVRGNKL